TSGNTALAGSTLLVSGGLGFSGLGRVGIQRQVAAGLPGPSRTIQPRTAGSLGGFGVWSRRGAFRTSPNRDAAPFDCQYACNRLAEGFWPAKQTRQDFGGLPVVS